MVFLLNLILTIYGATTFTVVDGVGTGKRCQKLRVISVLTPCSHRRKL